MYSCKIEDNLSISLFNFYFRYFLIGNLAKSEAEVVRIAGLLRGTEAASQALSVS
jgi:hypothetical protein